MNKQRISLVKILLLSVLLLLSLLLAISCGQTPPDNVCTAHTDSDGDEKCDVCGTAVPKPECTEHKDENTDGKCDTCGADVEIGVPECKHEDKDKNGKCDLCDEMPEGAVAIVNGGKTEYKFVISDSLGSSQIKLVNKLISDLDSLGVETEWNAEDDSAEAEYEVFIGEVDSRGAEYAFDSHTLGPRGYLVKVIGKKILVIGGSEDMTAEAIEVFKSSVLGIKDNTRKLTSVYAYDGDEYKHVTDDYRISSLSVNGVDLGGKTISIGKKTNYTITTATKIQELIYDQSGYYLDIDYEITDKTAIAIKIEDISGKEGFYVSVKDGCVTVRCEFENKLEIEADAFFKRVIKTASGNVDLTEKLDIIKNVRDIKYSDFGAKGDGKTDDYEAIRATHAYANEWGHTVIADRGATYYIGSGHTKSATIQTNTNWGDAKFIIDDSQISADNVSERQLNIFGVAPTNRGGKSYSAANNDLPITELYRGATNIGFAPGFTALVRITHSSHINYIRQGGNKNSGALQTECILVDKDGNIMEGTDPSWDYDSISKVDVTRADDAPITIQGGHFTTIYNQAPSKYTSYARGIWVYRSNVTVKNVKHLIIGEGEHGAPMSGFTIASYANNVTFDGIEYDNPKSFYTEGSGGSTVVMGSYEIAANYCTNITWQNCTQVDFWADDEKTYAKAGGLMGTNNCKNMNFINMVVSSFDIHGGGQNITIIGGQIEHINCIGTGKLYMEDTIVHAMYQSCAIILRSDYGSLWRGDATFKNVTLKTGDKQSVALFRAGWVNHDYGYQSQMPTNVYVEDLKIDSNIGLSTVKLVMDSAESKANLYYWDESIHQNYTDPDTKETSYGPSKNVYKVTEHWYIVDKYGYTYEKPEPFPTEIILSDSE